MSFRSRCGFRIGEQNTKGTELVTRRSGIRSRKVSLLVTYFACSSKKVVRQGCRKRAFRASIHLSQHINLTRFRDTVQRDTVRVDIV